MNAVYKLIPLKAEELMVFFAALKDEESDIFGLNVTIPYKQKVVEYMDFLQPFAQEVKAVNTVVVSPNRTLTGVNTDGPGFLAHLAELKVDTKNKKIALLGAGGAARAIIASLCLIPERPYSIRVYNHHKEKTDALIKDLKERMDVSFVSSVATREELNLASADLLINATPLGLNNEDPLPIDENLIHRNLLVYDVIYNPQETRLLRAAQKKGAKTANGLGMLFCQGTLSFHHWMGFELSDKIKIKMWKSLIDDCSSKKDF